ncbi:MAG: tRNA pseudouridine(38-40) synthase TruA [Firmicutes bacterium]|uniref:tRNA pseudouridine synthase A n=1 Tax=Candidatus Scybalomonas excrementavium TaxID=2840943 RepID=A0A9D9HZZ5_9FIRM|nr:tRNA pseudouridine(38-40) synthase TruA [Candidatus Scybalomonas excrementavium]
MRNIRLTIRYDGTKYNGWQRQGNTEKTIQGKLEQLLSKMTGEDIEIFGSGRTDAGVHALGQVANFHTSCSMTIQEMESYIQQYLPKDIAVTEVKEASPRFHSRLQAIKKQYEYRIYRGLENPVFERKYCWHIQESLNIDKMRKASQFLEGEHDFKSFCGNKKMKKSTIRKIESIEIIEDGNWLILRYTGNGFLMNMVRILTGTLIEVGQGVKRPEEMPEILQGKSRELAGMMAPAQGLFLVKVWY